MKHFRQFQGGQKMRKQYIKYEIDGTTVCVEAEALSSEIDDDISRDGEGLIEGGKFQAAIEGIKPAADAVLDVLKKIKDPSEISLEMGIKFGAKAGVILASADSEATMKVTVKWQGKS
jgi:hypothetical protein